MERRRLWGSGGRAARRCRAKRFAICLALAMIGHVLSFGFDQIQAAAKGSQDTLRAAGAGSLTGLEQGKARGGAFDWLHASGPGGICWLLGLSTPDAGQSKFFGARAVRDGPAARLGATSVAKPSHDSSLFCRPFSIGLDE